jgi:MSHA pilin protein MshC
LIGFTGLLGRPAGACVSTIGACSGNRGFSLVELIVVLVVMGVLAVVAMGKFGERAGFEARGYLEQAQALTRYAQKAAIAQRRSVFVMINAGSLAACFDAGCAEPVKDPGTGGALSLPAAAGVAFGLAPGSFSFDGLGRPNPDGQYAVSVSVSGGGSSNFTVERETGYVHP